MSAATSGPASTGRVLATSIRGVAAAHQMFVGGSGDGRLGARLDCVDPTIEELLGTVPAGTEDDADPRSRRRRRRPAGGRRWAGRGARRCCAIWPTRSTSGPRSWPASTRSTRATRSPACAPTSAAVGEIRYFAGIAGETQAPPSPAARTR